MEYSDSDLPAPLAMLHYYWEFKRGDRPAPSRADIDPVEMKDFLSNTMLIDVVHSPVSDMRFRMRLTGTHIVYTLGFEFTGKFMDELDLGEERDNLLSACGNIVTEMKPEYITGKINHPSQRGQLFFKCLGVPLSSDTKSVNIILVSALLEKRI